MNQKIKLTHKKFYNKWIYKISLKIGGISILRSTGFDLTNDLFLSDDMGKKPFMIHQKAFDNRQTIKQLVDFLDSYELGSYAKRIETNMIDLYTNDINFYQKAYKQFSHITVGRSEPKDLNLTLDTDVSSIVVKKYPHNKYRHKVFLLPHKMKKDKVAKRKLLDWIKTQSPRITCTEAIENWFMGTEWNWDRRYVLVEDDKTLLMLKLRNSDVVGRVYNYILSDK